MVGYITFLFITFVGIQSTYGMDCSFGTSDNIVETVINTCPRPIIDSKEEKYCCWTNNGKNVHCCELSDFVFNSISLLLPIIIICLVISFIVSCVCCFLCPFCCFYKRRSGGRVWRQGPPIIAVGGPYSVPPTVPYQSLSDGWVIA